MDSMGKFLQALVRKKIGIQGDASSLKVVVLERYPFRIRPPTGDKSDKHPGERSTGSLLLLDWLGNAPMRLLLDVERNP